MEHLNNKTQSKSKTIITRIMFVISLIVFTDNIKGDVIHFILKCFFNAFQLYNNQNKVTIHMGIQNDIKTNNSLIS